MIQYHSNWETHQLTANCNPPPSKNTHLAPLLKRSYVSPYSPVSNNSEPYSTPSTLTKSEKRHKHNQQIAPLIQYRKSTFQSTSPLVVTFPLSQDHHLITLVQYNVLRATMYVEFPLFIDNSIVTSVWINSVCLTDPFAEQIWLFLTFYIQYQANAPTH